MNWQAPTTWSRETRDGAYYIERHQDSDHWDCYFKGTKIGKVIGVSNAKKACSKHMAGNAESQ